jgi:hypothetical protein
MFAMPAIVPRGFAELLACGWSETRLGLLARAVAHAAACEQLPLREA